ncbi:uncharacterized protein LOC134267640 [Saccostrea cucullata]|uniref:uncharacterized protein LOC134267640 n=1 Tax=Saccostrea cuccullata TaxID=36930 RepID=UPI002ED3B6C4
MEDKIQQLVERSNKESKENERKNGMEINRFRGGGKVPLVISFTENCKRSHEDLMREFTDSYDSLVMKNSRDIPQIHQIYSEVFLVFVDFNERNIILEGDREPQQIRKETVEYIRNMGRTAVVIYHLHPDSGTLEDGRLYSRKLTSIEYHPTLKQLSSRDCVLSIYRQFSEDQKARLKDICDL